METIDLKQLSTNSLYDLFEEIINELNLRKSEEEKQQLKELAEIGD